MGDSMGPRKTCQLGSMDRNQKSLGKTYSSQKKLHWVFLKQKIHMAISMGPRRNVTPWVFGSGSKKFTWKVLTPEVLIPSIFEIRSKDPRCQVPARPHGNRHLVFTITLLWTAQFVSKVLFFCFKLNRQEVTPFFCFLLNKFWKSTKKFIKSLLCL